MIYTLAFSPQPIVEAIPIDKACQAVNESMKIWGCPKRIKIDNGLPFVTAGGKDIPTLSQLWWIGLGIEVHLNELKVPQQNGTVEGLHGICHRWSAPHIHQALQAYQKRINETNRIQREVYRIRKLGDKTRRQLYPELWKNPRQYNPADFRMDRIYENLATRVWERKVNSAGAARFWKAFFYVGTQFIRHTVTITYDPLEHQWLIRATDGRLLKTNKKKFFTKAVIFKHAGIVES